MRLNLTRMICALGCARNSTEYCKGGGSSTRIIIDTELQAIIVPDSYYTQVDKLNEIIIHAGGNKLDYVKFIRTCFDKAYETQVISQSDVPKLKSRLKAAKAKPAQEDAEGNG